LNNKASFIFDSCLQVDKQLSIFFMKNFIFLFSLFISINSFAQTAKFIGEYKLSSSYKIDYDELKKTLTINSDNTFSFHYYQNSKGMLSEKNIYGKGTWTSKGNYIYFHTQESDINDKYNLNFNNSKAVYKSKHPRDKSKRVIIPHLLFLETNIFWMKRVKLDKK